MSKIELNVNIDKWNKKHSANEKRGCFQITDVLYTMSFRDMLGWDKSKKMHPKYITFNLCHCYKAKNYPQLTKKSLFQAVKMTQLSFRHSGTSDFQKIVSQRSNKVAHYFFLIEYDM